MKLLPATASNPVRLFSYGGGIQSFAALILAAARRIDFPVFVYSNVGDDSENPATIAHVNEIAKPYAARHGIEFIEVQKTYKGQPDSVYQAVLREKRSIGIPVRMSGGAPGNRRCTIDFKIRVVDKWVKQNAYTHAIVGVGISTDEARRAKPETWYNTESPDNPNSDRLGFWKKRVHPLLWLGLSRFDCVNIIRRSGLTMPDKSSCWFCPFMTRGENIEQKRNNPALFRRKVELERIVNERSAQLDKDRVYFHPDLVPLENAVGDQLPLWAWYADTDETCQSLTCGV